MLSRRLTQLRDREDGVSLIELLMVILMLSVIGGVVSVSMVTSMRVAGGTQRRQDSLAELQRAVDRMARELRAADPVAYTAPTANTAVVTVYRDAPAFVTPWRYTYTYCAPAGATSGRIYVRREVAPLPAWTATSCAAPAPATVLIANVDNGVEPVFRFLTASGTAATNAKSVFRLQVKVIRTTKGQNPIDVTTSVRVRNAR